MKFEHWKDDDGHMLFHTCEGKEKRKMLSFMTNPIYCCTIEADTHNEVMQKYHEHQGWEPYIPMENT